MGSKPSIGSNLLPIHDLYLFVLVQKTWPSLKPRRKIFWRSSRLYVITQTLSSLYTKKVSPLQILLQCVRSSAKRELATSYLRRLLCSVLLARSSKELCQNSVVKLLSRTVPMQLPQPKASRSLPESTKTISRLLEAFSRAYSRHKTKWLQLHQFLHLIHSAQCLHNSSTHHVSVSLLCSVKLQRLRHSCSLTF